MAKPAPYVAPSTFTPDAAGELARRARKLLRRGLITHRDFVLLDCLLWSCRKLGTAETAVSYTTLQRLVHMSRESVAGGLRRLGRLGLVQKIKRRFRVAWGGSVASRQATNLYRFAVPDTEFGAATVIQEIQILMTLTATQTAARDALAARREAVLARMRATVRPG